MNNMNFWRAAQKVGPAGCTTGRAIKAGPQAAEKPVGQPFCAASRPGPLSHVQPSEIHGRVSLSFKRCGSRGVVVRRYSYYANGFRFDSHLADFCVVCFLYFFSGLGVTFKE